MSKDNYKRYRVSLELREILDAMTPTEFEAFIGELFQQMGYNVSITSASGDEGVDLFLEKEGRKAIVQCKRQKGSIGQPVVRDFLGAMVHNRADQGFIVTTGTFSLPAQTWAQGKPIQLVDGAGLLDWIKSFSFPSLLGLLPEQAILRLTSPDTAETPKAPSPHPCLLHPRHPPPRRRRRSAIDGTLAFVIVVILLVLACIFLPGVYWLWEALK